MRTRRRWLVLGTAALVLVVAALLVFEPWKLVIDNRVDEAVPAAAAPVVLARGEFVSHEHTTTGAVRVLRLPDGSRVLRLEDLHTSNGPLLKVWLADAAVLPGDAGWRVFDDGRHVDLGDLKGNIGSSNYPIPADADLSALRSVTVWCDRFSVSFGAAALQPITT